MDCKKKKYESPVIECIELKSDAAILQSSTIAIREDYGDEIVEEW